MSLSLALQAAAVYAVALGLGHTGSPAHRRTVLIAASVAVAALPLLGWVPLAQPPLPEAFFGALEVVQEPSGMGVSNSSPPSTGTSWSLTLGHVWAIGLAMAVGRLGLDLLAVQRLWASARDLSGDVGFSDGVDTPMVVGVLRPRILLPPAAAEWSASRRTLVLAHERAHLDGHDNLWRLVSRAVACLHWFDPLAWLTLRALRDASEQHVDEQVLKRGFEATDYAEALIALARARPAALAMTMARTSGLERRVRAVLGPRRRPWPGAPWLGAGLVAAVACGSATTPARPDLPPPATETSSAWQTAIDHEAQRLMERYAAQGVAIVVLDAVSGEELAYADHGDLLSQLVNPGSVVKPFVVAAALEAGTPPDHRFDDGDMGSILARSSNAGARQIATTVGREGVSETFARVGLPVPPALPIERAALGDGLLVTPRAVAQAWRQLGGHGALAPEIASTTRELLGGVVEPDGTGRQAAVPGTSVAGKTGTAPWIAADGTPEPGRYLSSFVGLVPADDPELLVLVMVAAPQTEAPWGGEVAAPAFRRLVESRR